MSEVKSNWMVMTGAITSLGGPDVIDVFEKVINPLLDTFLRFGQLAVAIATVIFIIKKIREPRGRRRKS